MPRLHDLKEQRAAKIAEMRAINDKAMNDNRDLDDSERTKFDALDKETRSIGEQIDRAERLATFERIEAAGEQIDGGEMRRELRNYSLAKAATESLAGKLTGLEGEVHQELSKGRETRGLMVPTEILLGGAETRAITTTTPVGNALSGSRTRSITGASSSTTSAAGSTVAPAPVSVEKTSLPASSRTASPKRSQTGSSAARAVPGSATT